MRLTAEQKEKKAQALNNINECIKGTPFVKIIDDILQLRAKQMCFHEDNCLTIRFLLGRSSSRYHYRNKETIPGDEIGFQLHIECQEDKFAIYLMLGEFDSKLHYTRIGEEFSLTKNWSYQELKKQLQWARLDDEHIDNSIKLATDAWASIKAFIEKNKESIVIITNITK